MKYVLYRISRILNRVQSSTKVSFHPTEDVRDVSVDSPDNSILAIVSGIEGGVTCEIDPKKKREGKKKNTTIAASPFSGNSSLRAHLLFMTRGEGLARSFGHDNEIVMASAH